MRQLASATINKQVSSLADSWKSHIATMMSPSAEDPHLKDKATAAPIPVAGPSMETVIVSTEDPELEKRKRRAERFGIPLIDNTKDVEQPQKSTPEKIAKQFGTKDAVLKPRGKKRPAPTEDIDPEELERRKKRSERFGNP